MKKIVCLLLAFSIFCLDIYAQVATPGEPLPAWQKGYLDLHHINTGRGNAAFYILPDGTTIMMDAGEQSPLDARVYSPRNSVIKPDNSKKPYEWIAWYIQQVSPLKNKAVIDYALITHFHDDHFGSGYPSAPVSSSGKYRLSGITGVGDIIPIHMLLDRAAPGYNYPFDMKKYAATDTGYGRSLQNYFNFQSVQQQKGMTVAALKAGSRSQIKLVHDAAAYSTCYIQNIKSAQWIWTGKDSSVHQQFPTVDTSTQRIFPDENALSLAIAIHYGPFTYYTGGDNPGNVYPGDNPLRDVETPIAKAVGEVDIATLDHHGNRDAVNEFLVKTLKPRVWIGQSWSSDHPGHEVLLRMTNTYIYPGPRDLFATNMLEANKIVIGPLIDRAYKSTQGHIVVRVLPGGATYYIIILDDSTPKMPVKAVFGPYNSKAKS